MGRQICQFDLACFHFKACVTCASWSYICVCGSGFHTLSVLCVPFKCQKKISVAVSFSIMLLCADDHSHGDSLVILSYLACWKLAVQRSEPYLLSRRDRPCVWMLINTDCKLDALASSANSVYSSVTLRRRHQQCDQLFSSGVFWFLDKDERCFVNAARNSPSLCFQWLIDKFCLLS